MQKYIKQQCGISKNFILRVNFFFQFYLNFVVLINYLINKQTNKKNSFFLANDIMFFIIKKIK